MDEGAGSELGRLRKNVLVCCRLARVPHDDHGIYVLKCKRIRKKSDELKFKPKAPIFIGDMRRYIAKNSIYLSQHTEFCVQKMLHSNS